MLKGIKGRVVVIVGMMALLIVAYIIAQPYITVYRMKSAAEKHDGEALSEYIDFPSVRQSLKDQFNVILAKEMTQDNNMKDDPVAVFGAALVGLVVNKIVDALVTPAGITQMMAGEKPNRDPNNIGTSGKGADQEPWDNATMGYESLNKFVVKIKDEDGGESKFVFRREGFSWKLTQIIIPQE